MALWQKQEEKNEPEVNLLVFELKVASCFGKAANGDGSRAGPRVLPCETSCLGLTGKHSEACCSSLCEACEVCSTPVRAAWLLKFTACDVLFIHLLDAKMWAGRNLKSSVAHSRAACAPLQPETVVQSIVQPCVSSGRSTVVTLASSSLTASWLSGLTWQLQAVIAETNWLWVGVGDAPSYTTAFDDL